MIYVLTCIVMFGGMFGIFRTVDHHVQRTAEKRCERQIGAPCACGYIVTAPSAGRYVCATRDTPPAYWEDLQRHADEMYEAWLRAQPK